MIASTKQAALAAAFSSLCALSYSNTYASNFSYTYVGISLGKFTPNDELVYQNEIYEEFGLAAIAGSYQFGDNFALQASSSAIANEGPHTEISQGQVTLQAAVPLALGERVDVVPYIGFARVTAEYCFDSFNSYSSCINADDSGASYGVQGRLWAVPERFELNAGYSDASIEGAESAIAVGAAYWFNANHSIRASYGDQSDGSSYAVGYAFAW